VSLPTVKKHAELTAHSAALYALAPGRERDTLFSAGADKVVAEWNLNNLETNAFAIRTEHTVYSLLRHERTLFIGTISGGIHQIDLDERTELRHLKLHEAGIFFLHKSDTHLYAAGGDGRLSVWSLDSLDLLWNLQLTESKIRRVALDQSADLLAVACGDGFMSVLETSGHREISRWKAHDESANTACFLPDGNLITGGKDAYLRIWNRQDGWSLIREIPAHNFALYETLLSPNGKWLVTVSRDKTVKVWDANDINQPVRIDRKTYGGHLNSVNAACWLEDENLLATCGDDRAVMLWKIQ